MLRTAVGAEAIRVAAALWPGGGWADVSSRVWLQALAYEPVLLTVLAVLAALSPLLRRQSYRLGVVAVLVVVSGAVMVWDMLLGALTDQTYRLPMVSALATACLVTAAILFYFDWRHYRLSPALSEARLIALQSRIRPHFLFNSLNSVLALVRADPTRAESMLQDLSDLYRALLSDARTLVPLEQELTLARAYVDIESQRFGDRLRVQWLCDHAPLKALVPPLLLQPLLENAVRYGVEPSESGADVTVEAYEDGGQLLLFVRNPLPATPGQGGGHRLALANIAERLDLHFDAEARLKVSARGGEFVVSVRLPLTTSSPRPARP